MLNAETKAKGALFTVKAEDRKENGPIMTGNFELEEGKIAIAAFLKTAKETGKQYLNLKVGNKNDQPLYGRLFRVEEKKGEKSPDYTGYVALGSDEEAPELRVAGWKTKSKDGNTSYISLVIEPPAKKSEGNGEGSELPL